MKWSTNKIVNDLKSLTYKKLEIEKQPQGGRYCRDIFIPYKSDGISIVGFNFLNISDVDNPIENIEYVEIRTFNSDSKGGLPKKSSKEIRDLYFRIVDYFKNKKIQIVDNLRDYF